MSSSHFCFCSYHNSQCRRWGCQLRSRPKRKCTNTHRFLMFAKANGNWKTAVWTKYPDCGTRLPDGEMSAERRCQDCELFVFCFVCWHSWNACERARGRCVHVNIVIVYFRGCTNKKTTITQRENSSDSGFSCDLHFLLLMNECLGLMNVILRDSLSKLSAYGSNWNSICDWNRRFHFQMSDSLDSRIVFVCLFVCLHEWVLLAWCGCNVEMMIFPETQAYMRISRSLKKLDDVFLDKFGSESNL